MTKSRAAKIIFSIFAVQSVIFQPIKNVLKHAIDALKCVSCDVIQISINRAIGL